jgi:hypothetical protein
MIGLKRSRPSRADFGDEVPQTWLAAPFNQISGAVGADLGKSAP